MHWTSPKNYTNKIGKKRVIGALPSQTQTGRVDDGMCYRNGHFSFVYTEEEFRFLHVAQAIAASNDHWRGRRRAAGESSPRSSPKH